ncbi:toll/interleukin-1 receptor domain-containing protein [Glycomyces xiaoerkulensis]|uniref:toll/interleukin-1 receptor domain-containing protein n=1 Tax=Glycomyces xiaoerkulensis TaxID=2038139 RepID=UPI0012FFDDBA|nr:TIR domain-containing protein [Glycomyces xiaoerkulensis]
MNTSGDPHIYDFDVALSYAGEDRSYVQSLANLLRERGIRVFYDEYMQAELWGSDLYVVLDEVYRNRARYTVAFVSRHYVSKPWTHHERQSAQARALVERDPYFLPVRLDDSELPGLRPTVGYIDARSTSEDQLAALIEQKLATSPGVLSTSTPKLRVPRTPDQERELLAQRPYGWEYMLYAGMIWQRIQRLETKWHDHEMGYARRSGKHLTDIDATEAISNILSDIESHTDTMNSIFNERFMELAFGAPGEPGDPTRIEHLAIRFVGIYEDLMDQAAQIRGLGVSDELKRLFELAAQLTNQPLSEIREFANLLLVEFDALPELLETGEPIEKELMINLTVDRQAVSTYSEELRKVRRRMLRRR